MHYLTLPLVQSNLWNTLQEKSESICHTTVQGRLIPFIKRQCAYKPDSLTGPTTDPRKPCLPGDLASLVCRDLGQSAQMRESLQKNPWRRCPNCPRFSLNVGLIWSVLCSDFLFFLSCPTRFHPNLFLSFFFCLLKNLPPEQYLIKIWISRDLFPSEKTCPIETVACHLFYFHLPLVEMWLLRSMFVFDRYMAPATVQKWAHTYYVCVCTCMYVYIHIFHCTNCRCNRVS